MKENYCLIKTKNGKCRSGGERDHINHWEKIHNHKTLEFLEQKMLKWKEHKSRKIRLGDKK